MTPHSIEKLCKKKETDKTAWVGFTAAGMAVVAFGSNFIPAKKCEVGNGVFFQFGMSLGILTMGIAVQLISRVPHNLSQSNDWRHYVGRGQRDRRASDPLYWDGPCNHNMGNHEHDDGLGVPASSASSAFPRKKSRKSI